MKRPARRSKRVDEESEPKVRTTRVALRVREKNCSKTRAVRVRPEYPLTRTTSEMKLMPPDFFQIDALDLAPRLLGKFLRRDNVVLRITEVEAYRPNDSACHGRFGVTPRTAPVFGPGGHAYVYLCYGLHMMLNIVADKEGVGAAVLIRSCSPVSGLETIPERRGLKTDKPVLHKRARKALFEMAITTLLKMLSEGKFEGLHEQLEVKVKGTAAEGTIENLFVGHYQQTTNSKRDISAPKVRFLSLDLGVENCKDVYASFDKYVEGDNNDNVKKGGISFTDFPPILQLQLARFKYDERLRTMVKVNSRYEYPAQLDIDRDDGKYLADKADRNTRNLYTLGSVIVHRGGVQDGKYFAIVRPTLADVWVKLEDGVVQKVDANRALNEQYGGVIQHPPFKFEKGSNAFMLVYIRESEKESIMRSIVTKEVTELVRLETCEGKDDNAIHEDAAANRFVIIKVWRYEDVIDNDGIYIPGVDLTDPDCSFRVDKHVSFKEFEDKVAEYFGVDTHRLRFYEPQDLFRFIWPRSSDTTVETMVGASDEVTLFLKFDTRPSYTGHPDILEFVGSDDQAARVTKPASGKSSARVTKRATKSQKA